MNIKYCDVCKKEITSKVYVGNVIIKGWFKGNAGGTSEGVTIEKDICKDCYEELFEND